MHLTSHRNIRRPGHVYNQHGVGAPAFDQPRINWKHVDGPLLYCSDGQLHWLTWRERFRLCWGLADIHDIDFAHRRANAALALTYRGRER